MGRRRRDELRRAWQGLIGEQRRSRLSVAEFCREHEVSPQTFYNWRRRLANSDDQQPHDVSFVPVTMPVAASASDSSFVLQLPNGVHITVPSRFDETSLARLLQVAKACEVPHA